MRVPPSHFAPVRCFAADHARGSPRLRVIRRGANLLIRTSDRLRAAVVPLPAAQRRWSWHRTGIRLVSAPVVRPFSAAALRSAVSAAAGPRINTVLEGVGPRAVRPQNELTEAPEPETAEAAYSVSRPPRTPCCLNIDSARADSPVAPLSSPFEPVSASAPTATTKASHEAIATHG